jgi:hypothetical protein
VRERLGRILRAWATSGVGGVGSGLVVGLFWAVEVFLCGGVFLGGGGGSGGGGPAGLGCSDGGCLSLKRAERWKGSGVLVAFDFFVLS